MNIQIFAQMIVSGALMGLVYALIAYGFQLTYATSKSINFGQGELVMLSAFFSLTLLNVGVPYWLMVPGGLLFGSATKKRRLDIAHYHIGIAGILQCGKYLGTR
jgi:branched-chain amino acid transport system permease protein